MTKVMNITKLEPNKTEAIKQYKLAKIRERIMKSREGTKNLPNLTKLVIKAHEEEDEKI